MQIGIIDDKFVFDLIGFIAIKFDTNRPEIVLWLKERAY
jgi:hypothetical protein